MPSRLAIQPFSLLHEEQQLEMIAGVGEFPSGETPIVPSSAACFCSCLSGRCTLHSSRLLIQLIERRFSVFCVTLLNARVLFCIMTLRVTALLRLKGPVAPYCI